VEDSGQLHAVAGLVWG